MKNNNKNMAGVGIGIITRGTVSIKWMSHMDKLKTFYPMGMFWKYVIVEGTDGWAINRNEVIEKCKKENFEWLLFIDDDVFIPKDCLRQLLAHKKDIVTGIYWAKTDIETPVIFEKMGAGPMHDFPIDKLFKVEGSGLGCCLINMKVFDAFDKAGIPYFKENWIMETEDGRKLKCPIGEDHYFFYHAKKLGFDIWADSGILCDHYDMNTKRFYPTEDIVRRVSKKALIDIGRHDLVKKYDNETGLDKSKKTIAFVNCTANPFAGDELERRGLGGSESDIINLSKIFAENYGFNVHVFCYCKRPGLYGKVMYHNLETSNNILKSLNADLLISSRNVKIFNNTDFKKDYNAKKVCLWAHDMAGDPVYEGFEQAYPFIDKIFALTHWHKKDIMKTYPFVEEGKFFIARNGVDEHKFKDRDKIEKVPGRLIYSSTPYRGLDILAEVFPKIRARVPHAHLKVYSSMKVYGDAYNHVEEDFIPLYEALKSMDGVEYSESVTQDKLAIEQMKAQILAYPNTYSETCCITALECQAAGTPIVTSDIAALVETVPDDVGIRIDGNPHSEEYKAKFVDAVVELLTNQEKWQSMHKACLEKDNTWLKVSKEWINEFFPEEKKVDVDDIKQAGNINTPDYWNKVYSAEIVSDNAEFRFNKNRSDVILKEIKDGDKVLDIGCGTGDFTRHVKKERPNCEVWGSDFSNVAIDYCRQKSKNIFYANHPVLNDDFEKNYFDAITIQHVIEHLETPEEMIKRAQELLKSDGTLILAIPLKDKPWREHLKIWNFNDIEELLQPFNCTYTLERHQENRKFDDGTFFQEAIVIIKFK